MNSSREPNIQRPPATLMLIGGALTIVSLFLTWFEIETGGDGSGDRSYKALDLMETLGTGLIVLGIALVIIGAMHSVKPPRRRGLAIVAIVAGSSVALTGALSIARPALALGTFGEDEVAGDFGISDEENVAEVLQEVDDAGFINVQPAAGALVGLASGILALLGGIFALGRRRTTTTRLQEGVSRGRGALSTRGRSVMDSEHDKTTEPDEHEAVPPDQPPTPETQDTARRLGAEGPGATGPGTPQVGGSTPADATGSTEPPPGAPSGGQAPPR